MKPIQWILYREKLNLTPSEVSKALGEEEFILEYLEAGTLKKEIAKGVIDKILYQYGASKDWFKGYEIKEEVIFKTGQRVKFKYLRNTVKAPFLGQRHGQHIEPTGEYLSYAEEGHLENLPDYEYGEIVFENPLVIPWDSAEFPMSENSWGWKSFLFETYKAKGQDLSNSLKSAGYDAIVTMGAFGEGTVGEIVNLSGVKVK